MLAEKCHVTETLVLSTFTDELDQLGMQLLLNDFITRNGYRRHTFALSNYSNKSH